MEMETFLLVLCDFICFYIDPYVLDYAWSSDIILWHTYFMLSFQQIYVIPEIMICS